jgi:hypothetical protein
MYKKAAKLKLRFETGKGLLAVENLFEIKMKDLETLIKSLSTKIKGYSAVSDDLAFLNESATTTEEQKALEEDKLRFEIAKDIYITRQTQAKSDLKYANDVKELRKLEEILQRKKDRELEEMSAEDLEKRISEMRAGMKE